MLRRPTVVPRQQQQLAIHSKPQKRKAAGFNTGGFFRFGSSTLESSILVLHARLEESDYSECVQVMKNGVAQRDVEAIQPACFPTPALCG